MAELLFIDVETYSSVDLSECGAYKYIESPDFEILIIGYTLDNGPVRIIDLLSGDSLPEEFTQNLMNPKCLKVAHNAVFERLSFRRIGYDTPADQWYCTMVKAAYCGLPLALAEVSKVLNLTDGKLDTGKALIRYFSMPCKPTKINGGRTRNYPHHAPEKWESYKEYNRYDVLAEREIYHKLNRYDIPATERQLYALDQAINDRGILIDTELAAAAIEVDNAYSDTLTERAKKLTGLGNPNSPIQIRKWIESRSSIPVPSLSKEAMAELMDRFKGYPDVYELLKIRQRLSKTSVAKYYKMINCACSDNRARGMFQFYGANRTGRWAGRLLQLQNMSKNHIKDIEYARELIRDKNWHLAEIIYDDVSDILSQLVRTALIAPKDKIFSVADFSAIEARVISWLSGEKWRMDVFKGDGKIYEATGARMFNVPIESITKGSELRDKSKISELALGYGGGVGALKRMGGERMGLTENEMQSLVVRWRKANPEIVALWSKIENAAKEAVKRQTAILCGRNLAFCCDGNYLRILLPSGRELFYKSPRFRDKRLAGSSMPIRSLCYEGMVQETKQWGTIDTYGGKLTENIVQAIARDLLCNSMMSLKAAGFDIVCHVHDEVIAEIPEVDSQAFYDKMVEVMSVPPKWASDLPLRADGYTTKFYLKD